MIWGAAWLYKASNDQYYMNFVKSNIEYIQSNEFGWDSKHAGINVLVSHVSLIFHYLSDYLDKIIDHYLSVISFILLIF